MVALTQEAIEAISGIVAEEEFARGAGLRIAVQRTGADALEFELSVEQAAADGDQLVEQGGARLFLEPLAATVLEDKLLDAHLHGKDVHFEVLSQSQGEMRPGS